MATGCAYTRAEIWQGFLPRAAFQAPDKGCVRLSDSRWKSRGQSLRRQSLALTIPTMYVGGPLGGGFVGWWLGAKAGYPSAGFSIGFVLGLAAAILETKRLLRVLARDD